MPEDNKLSLDILLEMAESIPEKSVVSDVSDAKKFVIDNKIESGPYKVQSDLIYSLYKDWKNYKNLTSRVEFMKDFSLIFQKTKYKGKNYYYINPETLNITNDIAKNYENGIVRPKGLGNEKETSKKGSA